MTEKAFEMIRMGIHLPGRVSHVLLMKGERRCKCSLTCSKSWRRSPSSRRWATTGLPRDRLPEEKADGVMCCHEENDGASTGPYHLSGSDANAGARPNSPIGSHLCSFLCYTRRKQKGPRCDD